MWKMYGRLKQKQKFNLSQQLKKKKPEEGSHYQQHNESIVGSNCSPVLYTGQTPSGMFCSALGSFKEKF